jgi:hypothetical protein
MCEGEDAQRSSEKEDSTSAKEIQSSRTEEASTSKEGQCDDYKARKFASKHRCSPTFEDVRVNCHTKAHQAQFNYERKLLKHHS